MVRASQEAGADAVKIQTYRAATLTRPNAMMEFEDGGKVSQFEFFRKHEVSEHAHRELKRHAEDLGLLFFSTPSHPTDVDLLEKLGVPAYKVGSDDLTNPPLLDCVARTNKPVVLSTGMCTLGEIEEAVNTICRAGNDQVVLLHCLVGYPARLEDANIRVISTLQQAFGFPVGFSDHTSGSFAATLAVALGAVMVEKHLTVDRSRGGPDDLVACEPKELASFVEDLRRVFVVLGDGRKRIMPGEEKWREAGRKSIVAARTIQPGELITREMVDIRRPATGLHPRYLGLVVGRRAAQVINEGELITLDCLTR